MAMVKFTAFLFTLRLGPAAIYEMDDLQAYGRRYFMIPTHCSLRLGV
jgi:hypothetical protein